MTESLERRVQRLEDRLEIGELVVRYATLLDDAQWDALGELFTQDGVFGSPHSTTAGRAEVVENFRVKHAPFTWTWHDPHGHVVEFVDDDHARGTLIGYAELGNEETTIVTSIRYQDEYRRDEGRWRFARRHVLSLYGLTEADRRDGGLQREERRRWPRRPAGLAELPDYDRRHGGFPG